MEYNERFELVPEIDEQKCIECGACQRICPSNIETDKHTPENCYACYAPEEMSTSSSGGIAAELAKKIVADGGCVFGAIYENGTGQHSLIDSKADLRKLKGNKYVQSYINDCYTRGNEEINRRKVFVEGNPCKVTEWGAVDGEE